MSGMITPESYVDAFRAAEFLGIKPRRLLEMGRHRLQSKQINLRRVWVKDTIVERLKTEDSEAPVPLTDLQSPGMGEILDRINTIVFRI
jgi:hypothetical protein